MSEEEIDTLAKFAGNRTVMWIPDRETALLVMGVGDAPPPKEGDEPEPSRVAYLHNGQYVALYNAELRDFRITAPIPA